MLKNVKSSYFIQNLFSYIDEYKKLKLVNYNKGLQKIINISIINYIHFQKNDSKIIYYSNETVFEFNKFGIPLFKGEYLNGKRNGKGKEYDEYSLYLNHDYYIFRKLCILFYSI